MSEPDERILVKEYWWEVDGEVWVRREYSDGRIEAILTPFKELPFIKLPLPLPDWCKA